MPTWRGVDHVIVCCAQVPWVQGLLDKVAVLILDSRGCVVEKYVVQLQVRRGADSTQGWYLVIL